MSLKSGTLAWKGQKEERRNGVEGWMRREGAEDGCEQAWSEDGGKDGRREKETEQRHVHTQHTPAHSSTLQHTPRARCSPCDRRLPSRSVSLCSFFSHTASRRVHLPSRSHFLLPLCFLRLSLSRPSLSLSPFLSLSLCLSLSPPTSNSPSAHLDSMATPPDTRPSTPGTPMTSTARDVFEFDERLFSAAGDLDKQTSPPSNSKQELFVFQWLATVERELKRCGHVGFPRRFKRTDYLCRMTWKLINLSLVVVGYFSHNATKPGEAAAQVNINAGSKAASSHQEAHRSLLSLALCPRKLFHFVRNNSNLAKSHRGRKGHGR